MGGDIKQEKEQNVHSEKHGPARVAQPPKAQDRSDLQLEQKKAKENSLETGLKVSKEYEHIIARVDKEHSEIGLSSFIKSINSSPHEHLSPKDYQETLRTRIAQAIVEGDSSFERHWTVRRAVVDDRQPKINPQAVEQLKEILQGKGDLLSKEKELFAFFSRADTPSMDKSEVAQPSRQESSSGRGVDISGGIGGATAAERTPSRNADNTPSQPSQNRIVERDLPVNNGKPAAPEQSSSEVQASLNTAKRAEPQKEQEREISQKGEVAVAKEYVDSLSKEGKKLLQSHLTRVESFDPERSLAENYAEYAKKKELPLTRDKDTGAISNALRNDVKDAQIKTIENNEREIERNKKEIEQLEAQNEARRQESSRKEERSEVGTEEVEGRKIKLDFINADLKKRDPSVIRAINNYLSEEGFNDSNITGGVPKKNPNTATLNQTANSIRGYQQNLSIFDKIFITDEKIRTDTHAKDAIDVIAKRALEAEQKKHTSSTGAKSSTHSQTEGPRIKIEFLQEELGTRKKEDLATINGFLAEKGYDQPSVKHGIPEKDPTKATVEQTANSMRAYLEKPDIRLSTISQMVDNRVRNDRHAKVEVNALLKRAVDHNNDQREEQAEKKQEQAYERETVMGDILGFIREYQPAYKVKKDTTPETLLADAKRINPGGTAANRRIERLTEEVEDLKQMEANNEGSTWLGRTSRRYVGHETTGRFAEMGNTATGYLGDRFNGAKKIVGAFTKE